MNSQLVKTGAIYLIINTLNYVNNVVPYLYIGSKEDLNTLEDYWSSSTYVKEDVQRLGKNNFIKIVLQTVPYREVSELLEIENKFHLLLNVVEDDVFYNKAYASGKLASGSVTTSGTTWVHSLTGEKRIKNHLLETYLDKGYKVGRLTNYNKGRTYINKNGIVKAVMLTEADLFIQNGWQPGRPGGNQSGKIWVHTETDRKLIPKEDLDAFLKKGWKQGCFRASEKERMNKS